VGPQGSRGSPGVSGAKTIKTETRVVYKSAKQNKDNYLHYGNKLGLQIKSKYVSDAGVGKEVSATATQLGGKSTFVITRPGNEHFKGIARYGDNVGFQSGASKLFVNTKAKQLFADAKALLSAGAYSLVNPEIKGDRAFVAKSGKVSLLCTALGGGFYVSVVPSGKLTCLPVKKLTANQIFSVTLVA
jgi:hypothetical protein